jgi:hypothetical protein
VLGLQYPPAYQRAMRQLAFINLDVLSLMATGCVRHPLFLLGSRTGSGRGEARFLPHPSTYRLRSAHLVALNSACVQVYRYGFVETLLFMTITPIILSLIIYFQYW